MSHALIISTQSGGYRRQMHQRLILFCRQHNMPYFLTKYPQDIASLSRQFAEKYGSDGQLFIASGDSGFREAIQATREHSPALGLIPMGTCNDFSKTPDTHIQFDDDFSLKKTKIRSIDLISANGELTINAVSLGLDTVILEKALELKKQFPILGKKAYSLSICPSLFRFHSLDLRIDLWDQNKQLSHLENSITLIAINNARYYGGGFLPAPQALLNDGLFDLCLVPTLSKWDLVSLIPSYKKGTHLNHPAIHSGRYKSVRIKSAHEFSYNIDGVPLKTKDLLLEIVPNALRLIYTPQKKA